MEQHPAARDRQSFEGDLAVDVAVVGAGFTGMWTAYHLAVSRPELRVAVIERHVVGFGAAGRNGGWAGAGLAGSGEVFARESGWSRTRDGARLSEQAVDDIGAVAETEGIACDFLKGGTLTVARTQPQWQRVQTDHANAVRTGLVEPGTELLSAAQVCERVSVPGIVGGLFTPHCARIQPARLVRGLADACERRGVTIFEHTPAVKVAGGTVTTAAGSITASSVLLATEAWTPTLPGQRRRFLPLTSMMVATAPLSENQWSQLGWEPGLTIRDRRHLFFYAQRTADDRIAIGGRGAPYRLRRPLAEYDERGAANDYVWDRLTRTLHEHFPPAAEQPVTHRWGGTLAVPRDWCMGVRYDSGSGLGSAGGYSGHGVVASYLAGRSLCDLVLGKRSAYSDAPWVNRQSRRWEPEPLRFIAANAMVRLLDSADRHEDKTGHRARRVQVVGPFLPPT